jgi:hypothetical protein
VIGRSKESGRPIAIGFDFGNRPLFSIGTALPDAGLEPKPRIGIFLLGWQERPT